MRNNIVHMGAEELTYEIRKIVEVAKKLENMGAKILWENIGDPVAKGETIPAWIKEIIKSAINDNSTFGYCPTRGLEKTRKFLAKLCNERGGAKISKDDVIFFNGLGDAISKVYNYLDSEARVIGPSPAYSTHSSAEGAHAGSEHITYNLDPNNNWFPNLEDMRNKIKYNPNVSGILIVNPDNPTGVVYPKKIVQQIVKIAEEFDLFIIADEIYTNITYNGTKSTPLSDVINSVCGISMKGISKELPWPGARCGWIEIYNRNKDPIFAKYVKSIIDAKMLEVCSTTLPQKVIPEIMSDRRYKEYHRQRNKIFDKRSKLAFNKLRKIKQIIANKANGAFYMAIVFKKGVLTDKQTLPIKSAKIRAFVENITNGVSLDKRFAYYLMASSGICVVPLTGFNCSYPGFRITLLESDSRKFEWIFETVSEKIKEYLSS